MNREENLCWRDFSFFAKPCTVVFIWAQTRTGKQVLIERKHDMLGNQMFEVLQPLSKLLHQIWKVFQFFDIFSINKYGRNLKPGSPLFKDFRNEVIQMAATRPIREIMMRKVSYKLFNCAQVHQTISRDRNIDPSSREHVRTPSKLLFGDSMLLKTIVQSKALAKRADKWTQVELA